jgi:hypothetical protein
LTLPKLPDCLILDRLLAQEEEFFAVSQAKKHRATLMLPDSDEPGMFLIRLTNPKNHV